MQKRTLGKTGLSVSVLGFGAAPIAYLDTDRQRSAKVINDLLNAGLNLIDTASSYPGSEPFLGEMFSNRRKEIVLVSKCGQKIPESTGEAWSARVIADTVDRSLRLLKTDHLDVMLLHSCKLDVLKKGEAIGALVKAREQGKTRFIGYSGDNDAATFAANLKEVDVIETSISFLDQINIDGVLPIARKNHVGVIAKRPIANAAWRDASQHAGIYREYNAPYIERFAKMNLDLKKLGFKGDWPELALRFTLSIEGVHTAIIGTTNPENASANVKYANAGALADDLVKTIRDAFLKADPNHKWTGQT